MLSSINVVGVSLLPLTKVVSTDVDATLKSQTGMPMLLVAPTLLCVAVFLSCWLKNKWHRRFFQNRYSLPHNLWHFCFSLFYSNSVGVSVGVFASDSPRTHYGTLSGLTQSIFVSIIFSHLDLYSFLIILGVIIFEATNMFLTNF